MRFGLAALALVVAVVLPALLMAGASALRGLAWLVVVVAVAVLLIDLTDRVTEWLERRRWGRLARRKGDRYRSDDAT
jgi:hypothetical protein